MNKTSCMSALLASTLVIACTAVADDKANSAEKESGKPVAIALFGDWPYNQNLIDNASLLINSINNDASGISTVIHVGDIHSGSMPCTSADILPPIASADPGWNQRVYALMQRFNAPVVYTPGDNEWTDCHKAKEKSSGYPLKELDSIRSLFFARPGHTLGLTDRKVTTQSIAYDPAFEQDKSYVENVMWESSKTLFVTINMPGSNNDTLAWTGIFANPAAQAKEVADRTQAAIRWLTSAFNTAKKNHDKAIVIAQQADMWDPAAVTGDGLDQYTVYVSALANLASDFGRPVLLVNGDSHIYGLDKPLADPNSASGQIHHTKAVPNLTRLTVQGSTNAPAEWTRLTIDTRTADVFAVENVPYCADPLGSCQ